MSHFQAFLSHYCIVAVKKCKKNKKCRIVAVTTIGHLTFAWKRWYIYLRYILVWCEGIA